MPGRRSCCGRIKNEGEAIIKPVVSIDTHTEKIVDDLIARIGWAQHFARVYRDGFCKVTGEPLEFHSLPWEQSNLPSERQG